MLFDWLDGPSRLLGRLLAEGSRSDLVVLAIDGNHQLTLLPWETLHDGQQFLIDKINPLIIPLRWISRNILTEMDPPLSRRLRVLFMATSPEGINPVLNYEDEENLILQETENPGLELQVEESGCLSELARLWGRSGEKFDVFHLSGHASFQEAAPFQPYFVMETETGEPTNVSAVALAEIFKLRYPSLIFLSGCRTGQGLAQQAVSSMAEQLIDLGAKAVLGWGLPVYDKTATLAAAHLYQRLAEGRSLAASLGLVFQNLRQQHATDWHLLRLYVRGHSFGALVSSPGEQICMRPTPQSRFLNPRTEQVRVANADEFVGRRLILKICLQHLRSSRGSVLLLYGIGGVGKSSIAARLLERLSGFTPLVLDRGLDEAFLLSELLVYSETEKGHKILQERLPLRQRLSKFFKSGLNSHTDQLIIVLDDFEKNLEELNGQYSLRPEIAPVFEALVDALLEAGKPHRVLITCRYRFSFKPKLYRHLLTQQVPSLQGADRQKKYQRLAAFQLDSPVDVLIKDQAKSIADGNPRLLECLSLILQEIDLDPHVILSAMQGKKKEFLEDILGNQLLTQQPETLRWMLTLGLIFHRPVPFEALAALWEWKFRDTNIQGLDTIRECLDRGQALGLIEAYNKPNNAVNYQVPHYLSGVLVLSGDTEGLARVAAETLLELWLRPDSCISEEQILEIHRLALIGKTEHICSYICLFLARIYNQTGKYSQALSLCEETLKVANNERDKILLEMGNAFESIGQSESALTSYYQVKLLAQKKQDQIIEGKATGNLGICYYNLGQLSESLESCNEALEMALMNSQEDEEEVLRLYLLRASIWITIGNTSASIASIQRALDIALTSNKYIRSEAVCYCNLCDNYGMLGDVQSAIKYGEKALNMQIKIDDLEGQATVLHSLGEVLMLEDRYQEANSCLKLGIEITNRINNYKLYSEIFSAQSFALINLSDLENAWKAAKEAEKYEYLPNMPFVMFLVGLIALKKNEPKIANDYFLKSLRNARQLSLGKIVCFKVLYIQFLALSGLALMSDSRKKNLIEDAISVYQKARFINQEQGVRKRIQQFISILEPLDNDHILNSLPDIR
jgi:tetratricopeptide (TPR) repeat protein